MPENVTEIPLTQEQIRRRERNERYRLKKAQKRDTKTVSSPRQDASKTLETPMVSQNMPLYAAFVVKLTLLTTINVLLIYFQAQTYLDMGMQLWTSLAISAICEGSLVYLSFSLRKSIMSFFLFISLFIYTLGTMTYGIKRTETIQNNGFAQQEIIKDGLRKTQEAFDLAASRKESGIMVRHLKTIETLSDKIDKTQLGTSLIVFQSYWLIALRAILMLISANLVHRLGFRMRENGII